MLYKRIVSPAQCASERVNFLYDRVPIEIKNYSIVKVIELLRNNWARVERRGLISAEMGISVPFAGRARVFRKPKCIKPAFIRRSAIKYFPILKEPNAYEIRRDRQQKRCCILQRTSPNRSLPMQNATIRSERTSTNPYETRITSA